MSGFFYSPEICFSQIDVICVAKRSSLENYASNNTTQHDTTRKNTTQYEATRDNTNTTQVQHDTTRKNTTQHEATRDNTNTTQVQHDTTRDNTSATRVQHEAKHSINLILIYLHHGCTLGTWYIKTEAV